MLVLPSSGSGVVLCCVKAFWTRVLESARLRRKTPVHEVFFWGNLG